jgi:uncharacterized LabA/DUF88 family protein
MNRIIFLIDGFNVYHSILALEEDTGYCTKWLDYKSLCESYIPLGGKDANLEAVYYFSAIPYYLNKPDKIQRHKDYIKCLESTGIKKELGRFKEKSVYCQQCRKMILKHEEKETDVAIAIKLFKIFHKKECDTAIIMTGDTDLSPAVRECNALFPNKKIMFAFPFFRYNAELKLLAPDSFKIGKEQYIKHQLPNPVILPDGQVIHKPQTW